MNYTPFAARVALIRRGWLLLFVICLGVSGLSWLGWHARASAEHSKMTGNPASRNVLAVQTAGTTITVNDTSGGTGGPGCKLRDAIAAANNNTAVGGCVAGTSNGPTSPDVIQLPAQATITLTAIDNTASGASGLPAITSFISIQGNNSIIERSTVAGTPAFRLFHINSNGNLRLFNTWLRGGFALGANGVSGGNGSPAQGGAINANGVLLMENCTISACEARGGDGTTAGAGIGGAIYSNNSLTLTKVTISNNRAWGGTSNGGNAIPGVGGGVFTSNCTLLCGSVTFSNNEASVGGGLYVQASTANVYTGISNSLFANSKQNIADVHFAVQGSGSFNYQGGYNLVETNARTTGNLMPAALIGVNADPMLGPFQVNAPGLLPTHALLAGSPAIDKGISASYNTDQRGWPRYNDDLTIPNATGGDASDIGAYEYASIRSSFTGSSNGIAGLTDSAQLATTPYGVSYVYSLANGSSLPPGLNLQSDGRINGTPTQIGTYNFNVVATSYGQSGTTALSRTIVCPPSIYLSSVLGGTAGAPYSQKYGVYSYAGTFTYAKTAGTLPPGLTLAADGTLSGIPTQAGTYNFQVTATGLGGCTGTQDESLTISCPVMSMTPTSIPIGKTGEVYPAQSFAVTPAFGTYSYTLTDIYGQPSSTVLPPGITLSSTGVLSGTPLKSGGFDFGIRVSNFGTCSRLFTYRLIVDCTPYSIAPANLPVATASEYYSQTFTAVGMPPSTTFTISQAPPGLSFVNGTLSGTPTSQGTFSFTIEATAYTTCKYSLNYSLTVGCPTVAIPDTLSNGTVGLNYIQSVAATPSSTSYDYSIYPGVLPPGLSLNRTTGLISGVPTRAGSYNFGVWVTGFDGCSKSFARTIVVDCPALNFPQVLPYVPLNAVYNESLSSNVATPYLFTLANGTLPSGLTLAPNGVLNGLTTASGVYNFTVSATVNGACTQAKTYTLVVGCPTIAWASNLPTGTAGTAYPSTAVITLPASEYGYTTALESGTLPLGMSYSSDGKLSGTPMENGSFTLTFMAMTTAVPCELIRKSYVLNIGCPAITLSSGTTPNGTLTATAGTNFSKMLTAAPAGGNYQFELQAGSTLPNGLSLTPNGHLSGIPLTGGTFTFTAKAIGFGNCAGTLPITITISCPTVTVSADTGSVAPATAGSAYLQRFSASPALAAGGSYSFALASGSTLPAGLTLSSNGTLSGTPTVTGSFAFTIEATGYTNCKGSLPVNLTIACPTVTLSPSGGAVAAATTGAAYTQSFTANPALPSGQSYNFTLAAGSTLPAGLTLATNGTLSGTPTVNGTFNFTLEAKSFGTCKGTLPVTLAISCPAITVSPSGGAMASSTAGVLYSQSFTASPALVSGFSYSYSLASGSTLPTGLTLSTSGVLSGTPTTAGTYNFTINATAYGSCVSGKSVTLTVACPSITLGTLPNATAESAYSQTISALPAGGSYSLAVTSGALPPGLTLATNGTLSGTPTLGGAYTFTVTATGFGTCTGSRQYTMNVSCSPALGDYPNATLVQGGSVNVTPNAAPAGSNFWITANSPGFPGVLSVEPATGVVRVSNAQTPGTYVVTVRAQGGCAAKTFTLTVTKGVSTCSTTPELTGSLAAAGTNPVASLSADFNGDGKLDVVTTNFASAGTVSILRGKSDGTFQPKADYAVGTGPTESVAADFNGDGKLDLAVAVTNEHKLGILKGNGDGSFQAVMTYAVGLLPNAIVAGDFNGDGKTDVVTANAAAMTVSLLKGNGDGTFQAKQDFAIGSPSGYAYALRTADVNGDGKLDLLAATNESSLSLLCGNGDGTFKDKQALAVGFTAQTLGIADFNSDGKLDVVVPAAFNQTLAMLRGNGDGTFVPSPLALPTIFQNRFVIADYNNDSKLDLAFSSASQIYVLAGNNDGTFTELLRSNQFNAQTNGLRDLNAADFNQDGKLDFFTTHGSPNFAPSALSNWLTVYQPSSVPTISQNNETEMLPGGTVRENVKLATVSDCDGALASLAVKVNGGDSATVNGVTVSQLAVQADGTLTARVALECQATYASFTLTVLKGNRTVLGFVTVRAVLNSAPALRYDNGSTVPVGQPTTISPTALSDFEGAPTISLVSVKSTYGGPFGGAVTVNQAGVVSVSKVWPFGFYEAVVRATDACGATTDATVYFSAQCPTLTLSNPILPKGLVGVPYNQTISVTGGTAPYTFKLSANTVLPPGITFNNGVFGGTPTQSGGFGLGITATDANGCFVSNNFYLEIINNTPPVVTPYTPEWYRGDGPQLRSFASVRDDRTPANALTVRLAAGGTATGLTITNPRVMQDFSGGYLAADVTMTCNATSGTVCFDVVDGDGATTKATINITIKDSGVQLLRYDNLTTPVLTGTSVEVSPAYGFQRPDLIQSVKVQNAPPGFTGSFNVMGDGRVYINDANPVGNYSVTIRATDKCNVIRDTSFTFNVALPPPPPMLITEWRMSGPQGIDDWYVELYNNTNQPIQTDGLVLVGVNERVDDYQFIELTPGRTIQPRGYYLVAGSAYSLTLVTPDESAPALGDKGIQGGWLLLNGLTYEYIDRAGTNVLLPAQADFAYEGTPVPALGLLIAEHAWVRKQPNTTINTPTDTNNNSADFVLVATTPLRLSGVAPKLGAPGPQNSATPPHRNAQMPAALFDPLVASSSSPNFLRDTAPLNGPQGNYPLGSFYLRRTFTNNTGAPVKKLRAHVIDITDDSVAGQANIRALDAADIIVNGKPVKGVTLDNPPAQLNGGGLNSSLTIRLSEPIPAGGKVNVQFRLGILRGGSYRFFFNLEATN